MKETLSNERIRCTFKLGLLFPRIKIETSIMAGLIILVSRIQQIWLLSITQCFRMFAVEVLRRISLNCRENVNW